MYMHELMLLSKSHVIQNYQLKIHILANKQKKQILNAMKTIDTIDSLTQIHMRKKK